MVGRILEASLRRTAAGFGVALLVGIAGCGSSVADAKPRETNPAPRKGELPPLADRYEDFDAASFDETSAEVDNRYMPLRPGSRLAFEGSDKRGNGRSSHRVEIIVTDLTRVIDGVETTVVWERDFVGDTLDEAELAYFAQDTSGNVWHLGEYSEVYDDGELVGATGFLKGYLTGALAGIIVPADPTTGTPSYSEGYGPPPINWNDRGRVIATGRTTRVPAGKYDDVVVIEEYNESERTEFQLKYYAPGIGNVRVGWRGQDESQETLVLTQAETLDATKMNTVRAAAGELEERARMNGTAPPATPRSAASG